ncbi:MAG: hypothetical protein J3K34DRAFT_525002 [Monoraphidium minutum]|nr:MAG: hypothetical protein J3K34DRAFT_525002 [Monoraphidium minutum]
MPLAAAPVALCSHEKRRLLPTSPAGSGGGGAVMAEDERAGASKAGGGWGPPWAAAHAAPWGAAPAPCAAPCDGGAAPWGGGAAPWAAVQEPWAAAQEPWGAAASPCGGAHGQWGGGAAPWGGAPADAADAASLGLAPSSCVSSYQGADAAAADAAASCAPPQGSPCAAAPESMPAAWGALGGAPAAAPRRLPAGVRGRAAAPAPDRRQWLKDARAQRKQEADVLKARAAGFSQQLLDLEAELDARRAHLSSLLRLVPAVHAPPPRAPARGGRGAGGGTAAAAAWAGRYKSYLGRVRSERVHVNGSVMPMAAGDPLRAEFEGLTAEFLGMEPEEKLQLFTTNLETGEREDPPPDFNERVAARIFFTSKQMARLNSAWAVHAPALAAAQRETARLWGLLSAEASACPLDAALEGMVPWDAAVAAYAERRRAPPAPQPGRGAGAAAAADAFQEWPERALASALSHNLRRLDHVWSLASLTLAQLAGESNATKMLLAAWPHLPDALSVIAAHPSGIGGGSGGGGAGIGSDAGA